mmetsp:Transcript_3490/g.6657  ORF Transcript_3490/g.6657 Transcript_3490/m.6657 type:complete len:129 (-) Transcript_3490:14-400(-)
MRAGWRDPLALRAAQAAATIVAANIVAELGKDLDNQAALLAHHVRSAIGKAAAAAGRTAGATTRLAATLKVEQGCSNTAALLPTPCQAANVRPMATTRAVMSPCRARGSVHNSPQIAGCKPSRQGAMP